MISITSNAEEVALETDVIIEGFPDMVEAFADDVINVMTQIPRKYIPAKHRKQQLQRTTKTATGRLWSGWGKRSDVNTVNPKSNILDNIAYIESKSDGNVIHVGTDVPYAHHVDQGRNTPEYLFSERGNEEIEIELNKLIDYHSGKLIGREKTSVRSRRQSRTQKRDVLGRFTAGFF